MTACNHAGAHSHQRVDWNQIDWDQSAREVTRLQARIVKAVRLKLWGKVKSFQRLLTRSFAAKALAVKRVTENKGKRTPGVDGVIWSTARHKGTAITLLCSHGYHPKPLRRVHIPKGNGKKRPLGIPTMQDRAMQALFLMALEPVAETTADPNSYGFRRKRSTADAMSQVFRCLSKKSCAPWVLEADITGCFDHISHEWLLNHIPMETAILRKWLKSGVLEGGIFTTTESGTPQGGIISPVLANMALDGLETLLAKRFRRVKKGDKIVFSPKVNLIRYADDFIITGVSEELVSQGVLPLVTSFLQERGLTLSAEKTAITHIDQGFDFLGMNVRKYKDTLLIRPSKRNMKRFLDNIRRVIRTHKMATQELLIRKLNPIITGWAAYHRHEASSECFRKANHLIWETLWYWAKRRHPKKGERWVKTRYFHSIGNRSWEFACKVRLAKSDKRWLLRLIMPADTKIRRHIKIRNEANPFDPAWQGYFEERKANRKKLSQWTPRSFISEEDARICRNPLTLFYHWSPTKNEAA